VNLIKRLPQHIVHHIAAGEVIEKPVSIVKELIENSLDAEATRIEIEVSQGGREKITISDNGHGIERKSIPLLFERYATSKISTFEDFRTVRTLGFRGEALFSIMNAADVTVMTRSYREQEGTWVRTHNGQAEEVHPTGCRVGTTIIIDRLFARFPVRKLTLDAKKDFQQIKQLITAFALAYPSVVFLLKHNGQISLSFFEHEEQIDRISKVWDVPSSKIVEVGSKQNVFQWKGFIAHPETFASHSVHQLVIINKRLIQNEEIKQAIEQGLRSFRHAGKFPRYVCILEIPPEYIDVNVHPQKRTLQIANHQQITDHIRQHIEQSFAQIPVETARYSGSNLFPTDFEGVKEATPLFLAGPYLQLQQTYILTPTDQGFILIDQHAADERLWYNKLLKDNVLLKEIERDLSEECKAELRDDIYQHSFQDQIDSRVATIACHQAIRAGEILTDNEMSDLVQAILNGGTETLVCPHGRPTHILISKNQLESVFRRT
jgi:DNA mismatch repair protein MutL